MGLRCSTLRENTKDNKISVEGPDIDAIYESWAYMTRELPTEETAQNGSMFQQMEWRFSEELFAYKYLFSDIARYILHNHYTNKRETEKFKRLNLVVWQRARTVFLEVLEWAYEPYDFGEIRRVWSEALRGVRDD
jgi:hypothetical protein